MKTRNSWLVATSVVAMVAVALALTRTTSGRVQYEVWAIDQSDSPGKTYGGTLYIWDGHELEKQKGVKDQSAMAEDAGAGFNPLRRRPPSSERIDLGGEVSLLCLSRTGANPVRPHMIAVNPAQTHSPVSASMPAGRACGRPRVDRPPEGQTGTR
jgi:hypothetical protein